MDTTLLDVSLDLERAADLGFEPVLFDVATMTPHRTLPAHAVWARTVRGEVLVVKPTLRPGFMRDGYFYTVSATARAIRDW